MTRTFAFRAALVAAVYAALCVLVSSRTASNDAAEFFRGARFFAQTGVYGTNAPGLPVMGREPGYAVFLGILFRLFGWLVSGSSAQVGLLVACQSLLYAATCLLLFRFAPLPRRVRFFFLLFQISSSALLGANAELYTETLAVSCLNLFLLGTLRYSCLRKPADLMLAAISYAIAVLTKGYLLYFLPCFFLAGVGLLLFRRERAFAVCLIAVSIGGGLAQRGWDARNAAIFGEHQDLDRVAAAMSGKILRAEELEPGRDWEAGFVAAVGDNLCRGEFGADTCAKFNIWHQDGIGFPYWEKTKARYGGNAPVALAALKREMWGRYFEHPGKQLFASLLEAVRIFFFEAPPGRLADLGVPLLVCQGWHVLGSMLFWGLAIFGVRVAARETRAGATLAVLFLVLHFALMSQVGNMTRYAFPFTSFLYLLAAFGASRIFAAGKAAA